MIIVRLMTAENTMLFCNKVTFLYFSSQGVQGLGIQERDCTTLKLNKTVL